MRKFKFFIDFEKEEKWLEDMAQKGYQFIGKSFGYTFRKAEPERATIKIDYRTFKRLDDFVDYCTLFEDSGWKHLSGSKSSGSQYFKKVSEAGEEDIFSDKDSKAGKYKRLSKVLMELGICYIPIFAALISTDVIHADALFNPKQLYFTADLWELTGADFWKAFLFETPFALIRGIVWYFLPVTIILYLIFAIKANKLYEHNKE